MPDAHGKKKISAPPALLGREQEVHYIGSLLAAGGAYIPFLWGKPGSGKTVILDYLKTRPQTKSPRTGLQVVSAPLYLKSPSKWEKSDLLLIDHTERLSGEAFDQMMECLDSFRKKTGRRAVLTFATGTVSFDVETILRKYRFLKPVEIKPLGRSHTSLLLTQFAKKRGVAVTGETIDSVINVAQDFFSAKTLPGSAMEIFDIALSMAKDSGRTDQSEIMEKMALILGVDPQLLSRSAAQRVEWFLESRVSRLDQIRLSQAGRAMANVIIPRLSSSGARRKPLGSFIIAGMDTRPVHEFAKDLALNLFGFSDCFLPLLLIGRGREETPAILGKIRNLLDGRPGGVVVLAGVEKAALNMIEALEKILEEGIYQEGYSKKTDLGRTILIFSTEVGDSLVTNANYVPSQLQKNVIRDVQISLPPPIWKRVDGIFIADQG